MMEEDIMEPESYEVSLESDSSKPQSTEELRRMLKQAGTELTVNYLLGKISFAEYSDELQKSKLKSSDVSSIPGSSRQELQDAVPSSLPNFEAIMEQDFAGDEESEDDEEDEEEEEEQLLDFVDSKEDVEWTPSGKGKKAGKEKVFPGKKKGVTEDENKSSKKSGVTKVKKRRKRRQQFAVPKALAGTHGEAVLLRAQGNLEEAVELFFEVIKQAPKAAAPYEALGSIHEEKGNLRQAVKFYMLAANLRGSYATEWPDIVDMCRKLNDEKLTMTCFTKGLSAGCFDPEKKLHILRKKCQYYTETGKHLKSLHTREQMLPYLGKTAPSSTLAFARDLVHDFLEVEETDSAISTLLFMTKEFPNDIDSEDVHHLVELQLGRKGYIKALETIVKHCGVQLKFSDEGSESQNLGDALQDFVAKKTILKSLEFPSLMPVDLRAKLFQCFIRIKVLPNLDVLKDLVDSILAMDVDEYGDVHYDIAEALTVSDYHQAAVPILEALVRSEKYNEAAVWLTLGQCQNALGNLESAIKAYEQVVDLAPGHHEARVTLSSLLQQMGQNEVAIQILSDEHSKSGEQADQELLLHKCQLLHSQGKTEQFISATLRLLSFYLPRQFSPEMVKYFMGLKTIKARKSSIPAWQNASQEPEEEANKSESILGKGMSQADKLKFAKNFYDIFIKLCRILKEQGSDDKLLETTGLGMTCLIFHLDLNLSKNIEFLCLKAGPVNENVYLLARSLATQESTSSQVWNLYNYILTRSKGAHLDFRFTTRLLMKNPNSMALTILNGNERLGAGNYTQALAEYMAVFKMTPDNDMVIFCAALCLLHIASSNHVFRKNHLIVQINCLLNLYRELRGECQETYYNIGRAWEQLNIQYAAVHYYKKALEFPPMVDDGKNTFDLRREIAYNLSRLYLKSNNPEYARYYLEKYCTI